MSGLDFRRRLPFVSQAVVLIELLLLAAMLCLQFSRLRLPGAFASSGSSDGVVLFCLERGRRLVSSSHRIGSPMSTKSPNQPAAPNAAMTSLFQSGHHMPGIGQAERQAASFHAKKTQNQGPPRSQI